jgi:hypothetical protein
VHIHSRLTILVEELKETIHLDIPPFWKNRGWF